MERLPRPNGKPNTSLTVQRAGEEEIPPARLHYIDASEDDYLDGRESEGLLEYWHTLRRNKGTVAVGAFLGALLGILLSLPQTPIYRARTTLEIETFNDDYLNLREVNPTTAVNPFSTELDISTQVKVLESESLVTKVVEKLGLEERLPASSDARFPAWREALGLPAAPQIPPLERAVAAAMQSYEIEPSRRSRIIEIFSAWPDPGLAADFANTLAETFIEHNLEARWKSTQRSADWLSRQLDELRVKLEKSEEKLQRYARMSGLLFTSEKDSVAEEKLRQLQAEHSKAQASRIARQSHYELARTADSEALPDILDNEALRNYQVRLTDLRRELADLTSAYTPAHYKVQSVRVQIEEIERAIRRERNRVLDRIRNEYEAALRREKLLEKDYANQAKLVSAQANKAIQYNIYKREVETNRQLYDNLLQRVKEAGVASAMRASNVRVVDQAKPPRRPYKPNHVANAALGLLAGIVLAVAFVFISERADRSVKQPGDAANYLRVAELGVIPVSGAESAHQQRSRRRLKSRQRKPLEAGAGTAPNGSERAASVELTAWQRKPTLIAESFRAALTSILFTGQNGHQPRILVITSPSPGEGKTTVVSNLAICLAEINRRVLLIDADMRKPRIHKIFDLPNRWGLSDLLRRPLSEDQDTPLQGFAVETEIPNLYVLPSGTPAHSIPNLLHSARTAELLGQAREEFDSVLIDTPPMMQISDARVLGQMSDGVILVLRAGQTTRGTAKAAAERFADDGTQLMGTILNSWNPKTNGYGYYDSYRYYDGYYSGGEEGKAKRSSG